MSAQRIDPRVLALLNQIGALQADVAKLRRDLDELYSAARVLAIPPTDDIETFERRVRQELLAQFPYFSELRDASNDEDDQS